MAGVARHGLIRSSPRVVAWPLVPPPPSTRGAVRGLGGWDPIAQRMVREAGVLPSLPSGGFGGAQRLDGSELNDAFAALSPRLGVAAVRVPARRTSRSRASTRLLVEQLGMSDVAQAVQAEARAPGLRRRPRFGTEVVAR